MGGGGGLLCGVWGVCVDMGDGGSGMWVGWWLGFWECGRGEGGSVGEDRGWVG